jgi:protoporphyrinogen oxidase
MSEGSPHVVVIGGGFTGLAAAYQLTKRGARVTVLERDSSLGGLAGGFDVGGHKLERFYHHWFNNDVHIADLVREIGCEDQVVVRPTRTGMYYAQHFYQLSSPIDLIKFTPLNLLDRLRLGWLVIAARAVTDWTKLDHLTAREWLIKTCGREVYRVVWEPLLVGKFGPYADQVSAVWFWKKIALRGGSRSPHGREMLAYYKGGFAALADTLGDRITEAGAEIRLNTPATGLNLKGHRVEAVEVEGERLSVDAVLATAALPQIADLVAPHLPAYAASLRRIRYLANVCLILVLDRSLSDTYWLNVGDPSFPFVGIIEHTNFEPPASYGGRHIVYLSKYLPTDDPLYRMTADEALVFALPHIQRMFPDFERDWIRAHYVWHADYAQPIMERRYCSIVPPVETPLTNFFISTMAQVYPEDRGTNYAIRDGRAAAERMLDRLEDCSS